MDQVILVGSRDLDPPEIERIENGELHLVEVSPDMGAQLRDLIAGRRVYIHLDCDVMDAGLLPTELPVLGGLSFQGLQELSAILAEHDIIGLEIAEFEGEWPNGETDDGRRLIAALQPVLSKLR